MRTFLLVCTVALIVAVGMAFWVGLLDVTISHSEDRCTMAFTLNTSMIRATAVPLEPSSSNDGDSGIDEFTDIKGRIAALQPERNEFVVTENVKNWAFQLAKDGRVTINDVESKLSEVRVGDDATVTFVRQGSLMLASNLRCVRK